MKTTPIIGKGIAIGPNQPHLSQRVQGSLKGPTGYVPNSKRNNPQGGVDAKPAQGNAMSYTVFPEPNVPNSA